MNPIHVSIIIEGYNESLEIGCIDETLDALRRQTFPLGDVEILLVGSREQAEAWSALSSEPAPFAAIRVIATDGDHYYALKNRGAEQARGSILAFLDSDVMPDPGWLGALAAAMEAGAEATCGPSLFRSGEPSTASRLWMQVAAAISWGFILGRDGKAKGFLSHNLGIRKSVFDRLKYRTDLGRTCAGSFLMDALRSAGIHPRFVPAQRVAHAFFLRWWATRLHVRFGHEVYLLYGMGSGAVSRTANVLGPLRAFLAPPWHFVLDFPQWWRYSKTLGLPVLNRLAGLLLVIPLSLLARGAEGMGMLATVLAPRMMSEFAAQN